MKYIYVVYWRSYDGKLVAQGHYSTLESAQDYVRSQVLPTFTLSKDKGVCEVTVSEQEWTIQRVELKK